MYQEIKDIWPEDIDYWKPDPIKLKKCLFMTELPNEYEEPGKKCLTVSELLFSLVFSKIFYYTYS
jgi:hypothetical protein